MVLQIPDGGLVLDGAAVADLPQQAFAVTLSDSMLEDMIACVQSGQGIQLSTGSTPSILLPSRKIPIPNVPPPYEYDLLYTNTSQPSTAKRLPNPTMSIWKGAKRPRANPPKASNPVKKPSRAVPKGLEKSFASGDEMDTAVARLQNSLAKAEAEKRENSATIVDAQYATGAGRGLKVKPGRSRLLVPTPTSSGSGGGASRSSIPPSPAPSGAASPSVLSGPSTSTSSSLGGTGGQLGRALQQRAPQRIPIIHELAVQSLNFDSIYEKWDKDLGSEQEFTASLKKVADFDDEERWWVLKRAAWKQLDVFQYPYASDEQRERAIANAVKQFDRMRLPSMDPVWQNLLPEKDRGKGTCLSKLQPTIANLSSGASRPSSATLGKLNAPKTASPSGASATGGDQSELDEAAKKGGGAKGGGESMSRSSSAQGAAAKKKKLSPAEAQAKRILGAGKKTTSAAAAAASTGKASPKTVSPAKSTASRAGAGTKSGAGRVLSKETVSDSGSDDEAPLLTSMPKLKVLPAARLAERPRAAEKAKLAGKAKDPSPAPLKSKPTAAATTITTTTKATGLANKVGGKAPFKAPPASSVATSAASSATNKKKRAREVDDEESSSSGTPPSHKRMKVATGGASSTGVGLKKPPAPAPASSSSSSSTTTTKQRSSSTSDRPSGRAGGSSLAAAAAGKTRVVHSSAKPSPLASSPPANASDADAERPQKRRPGLAATTTMATTTTTTTTTVPKKRKAAAMSSAASTGSADDSSSSSSSMSLPMTTVEGKAAAAAKTASRGVAGASSAAAAKNKRPRLSQELVEKADRFKQFYARYAELHRGIDSADEPDLEKLNDLLQMHQRLGQMKQEIYDAVELAEGGGSGSASGSSSRR